MKFAALVQILTLLSLAPMTALAATTGPFSSTMAGAGPSAGGATINNPLLPQISIGFGLSTLGAGVTANIHDAGSLLGVRVQANLFHFGINISQNAAKTHAQANLQNESLVLDLYPDRGHFYISAGIVFNQNNASFTSTPQLTGSLLGFLSHTNTTSEIGNVHGPIRYNPIAPYLGFGYDWKLGNRIVIGANIGAMYQGHGSIDFTPTGMIASNPRMRAGMEANTRVATSFMNKLSFYPIFGLTLQYRF